MNARPTFYACCLVALALSAPARAQESVSVRTADHAGYVRLVFDWAQAVPYSLNETAPDSLRLAFGRAAALDASGADVGSGKTVTRLRAASAPGEALQLDIDLAPGTTFRHFAVGSRVILDLMNAQKQA